MPKQIDGNGNGWVEGGNYSSGNSNGGGRGTYNPNITPFDPKDDLTLIRGNITKPRPNQPTPEQNFYNNDFGGITYTLGLL